MLLSYRDRDPSLKANRQIGTIMMINLKPSGHFKLGWPAALNILFQRKAAFKFSSYNPANRGLPVAGFQKMMQRVHAFIVSRTPGALPGSA